MANIGKSITIKGDLSGDEDVQVEGTVEGRIDLPNNELTVGSDGHVNADRDCYAIEDTNFSTHGHLDAYGYLHPDTYEDAKGHQYSPTKPDTVARADAR